MATRFGQAEITSRRVHADKENRPVSDTDTRGLQCSARNAALGRSRYRRKRLNAAQSAEEEGKEWPKLP